MGRQARGVRGGRDVPAQPVVKRVPLAFECVVVDDCSTDDSASVVQGTLDELSDPRFRLVRLGKNVGQTGATRRGLAETRATFVCFLDSDDLDYVFEAHTICHRRGVTDSNILYRLKNGKSDAK